MFGRVYLAKKNLIAAFYGFGPLITCEGNKASTSDVLSAKVVCLADKFCISFFYPSCNI